MHKTPYSQAEPKIIKIRQTPPQLSHKTGLEKQEKIIQFLLRSSTNRGAFRDTLATA